MLVFINDMRWARIYNLGTVTVFMLILFPSVLDLVVLITSTIVNILYSTNT